MAEEISTQNAVVTGGTPATTSPGHAGLPTQVAGAATTVSARDRYWRCRSRQFYRS